MKNMVRTFRLSITQLKILQTVADLNSRNAFPSVDGVAKIINGVNDQETKVFTEISTFATLLSYRGRKLSALVTSLYRHGYLTYVFEDNSNTKYLKITSHGQNVLASTKIQSVNSYRRKEKKFKPTIIYK
ncbi:MAG: RQC domain-containing protein [Bacilli bacterium]|nr:RQC domain-containing protein [Bacilli bacterium]